MTNQDIKIKDFFKLTDNSNLLELEAKASSFCNLNYGNAMTQHEKYEDEVYVIINIIVFKLG